MKPDDKKNEVESLDSDLDDFEDFADDDLWEDLDDEDDDGDIPDIDVSVASESLENNETQEKKKSKNKTFTFVVIILAFFVAIGIIVGTMSGGSHKERGDVSPLAQTPGESAAVAGANISQLETMTALPPQPTPISADVSEGDFKVSEEIGVGDASPDILTPMPQEQESTQTELAELGFDLEAPKKALSAEQSAPAVVDDIKIVEPPSVPSTNPQKMVLGGEESSPVEVNLLPSSSEQVENNTVLAGEVDRLDDKIGGLDKKFTDMNQEMSKKIEMTNSKIDNLTKTLTKLDGKLEKMALQPASPIKAQPEKASEKVSPILASESPVKNVKPSVDTKPKPVAKALEEKPQWVLKSAQPGKATLSAKGSNDLKRVEVGDTLLGIGRISAIEIINGKWVVKGTQGSVSQ